MKFRTLMFSLFAGSLVLASCGDSATRSDGTAGQAVSNLDEAAASGGVQADAVVIDNEAGPTITANPDSVAENPRP